MHRSNKRGLPELRLIRAHERMGQDGFRLPALPDFPKAKSSGKLQKCSLLFALKANPASVPIL